MVKPMPVMGIVVASDRGSSTRPIVSLSRAGCGPGRDAFASLHGVQLQRGSAIMKELLSTGLQSPCLRHCRAGVEDAVLQGDQTLGGAACCRVKLE
eukprot:2422510-Pyramimonas_sp.AAC.1